MAPIRHSSLLHCIPKKCKKSKMQCQTIHMSTIIVLVMIILKLNSQKEGYTINYQKSLSYFININPPTTFYATNHKAQKTLKSDKNTRQIYLLLILLSNDVQPNPGPKPNKKTNPMPDRIICSRCGLDVKTNSYMKCNQCSKNYHLDCSKNTAEMNGSFEWVCPTITCHNNHEDILDMNVHGTSPNRFEVLIYNPDIEIDSNPHLATENSELDNENQSLLLELPRISHEDYQGKDLCRGCYLPVRMNQQAISCDKCNLWIHRKCSDMSKKAYDKNRYLKYFNWNCNKCREDEPETNELFDSSLLKESEQPQSLNQIAGQKNEMLIINMNCRSSINKSEELQYIFNEVKPDIACHTETWFDDSVPSQAYIPTGYKVIRKDRSEGFKQHYGKNSGGGVAIYFKDHLKVERNKYLSDEMEEILWVHVNAKPNFMLGTIYRANYTDTLNDKDGDTKIEQNIRKASEISDNL